MDNKKLLAAKVNLKSLIFWLRNKAKADFENDIEESEKSHKSILFIFSILDDIGVTFRTQNEIMYNSRIHDNLYISDIIEKSTIYFRNGFEINGSELNKVF